jgi:hypothetical protein
LAKEKCLAPRILTSKHHQRWKYNNADVRSRRPSQEESIQYKKVKVLSGIEKMPTTVAITADSCDPVALRWEQLIDHNIGLILQQVGCSQNSKWKDNTLDNVRQSYY